MDKIKKNEYKTFEDIKHTDEYGNEYWYARELQTVLRYTRWEKFLNVVEKAKMACENSSYIIDDHFHQVGKMVQIGSGAQREKLDYELTRYACYLIVQNSDPSKEVVAFGQTYFAIQTRKQELTEQEYNLLEETANDIAKRKGLRYREDILDNMGSDELAANIFRISQVKQKLENDSIQNENEAFKIHNKVGKAVRNTIKKLGGTMPEKLPTPKKSLKQLEKEKKLKIINSGKN